MKKIFLILILFTLTFSLTSCTNQMEVTIGDFVYILDDYDELVYYVVGLSEEGKTKKELTIPGEINGIPVTCMGYRAIFFSRECFFESENLEVLYLTNLITIDNLNIFKNCPNFKKAICLDEIINDDGFYFPSSSAQGKEINGEYIFFHCYVYLEDVVIERGYSWFYRPANIVYFGNEEELYYLDFNENIIEFPKDPIKEGYEFKGWYKEKECINKWDIENDKLPEIEKKGDFIKYEVTKLYAKWEEIK